jgi:hypothetical protein
MDSNFVADVRLDDNDEASSGMGEGRHAMGRNSGAP